MFELPTDTFIAMFAAETAPPKLRGALTMQWQLWTAFGIMVRENAGNVAAISLLQSSKC